MTSQFSTGTCPLWSPCVWEGPLPKAKLPWWPGQLWNCPIMFRMAGWCRMATNSNHWAPKVDGTLSDPKWAVNSYGLWAEVRTWSVVDWWFTGPRHCPCEYKGSPKTKAGRQTHKTTKMQTKTRIQANKQSNKDLWLLSLYPISPKNLSLPYVFHQCQCPAQPIVTALWGMGLDIFL